MKTPQADLLEIFNSALASVNGLTAVRKEIENSQYPEEFHLVAIGKAADSMLQGVPEKRIKSALLISKHGHISDKTRNNPRVISIESDHPVPQQSSLKAGEMLLDYLGNLPAVEPCVFLISGGASALVEVLEDGWDLQQLQELTDYLLANAYPINEINAIRRRLSKIKGGGLWQYIGERPVYALLISDVPDDDPAVIGSGVLFPVNETEVPVLPEKWLAKFKPYSVKVQGGNFYWKIIASLAIAKEVATETAEKIGYQTQCIEEFLQGEAAEVASECVDTLKQNPSTLFIWGGETTVNLPKNAGSGGRNQHLALAAAIQMQDMENSFLLSAGTDGTDGLTNATGALVDNNTVKNGLEKHLNAADYLINADSNTFLQALNATIITGATGTNVMDLVIALYDPV